MRLGTQAKVILDKHSTCCRIDVIKCSETCYEFTNLRHTRSSNDSNKEIVGKLEVFNRSSPHTKYTTYIEDIVSKGNILCVVDINTPGLAVDEGRRFNS